MRTTAMPNTKFQRTFLVFPRELQTLVPDTMGGFLRPERPSLGFSRGYACRCILDGQGILDKKRIRLLLKTASRQIRIIL